MALAELVRRGDDVAVAARPRKLKRLALLMAGMAVCCAAFAAFAHDESVVVRVLVGCAAGFVTFIGIRLWRMSTGGGTLLVVTDDGLRFERGGLISWDEIAEVERRPFMGSPALAIHPRDPYLAVRRQGLWWAYPFAVLNRILGQPQMLFTEKTVPVDELYEEIERRRGAAASQDALMAARLAR